MADAAPLLIPALGVVAALLARRSFAAKARFSPVAARLSTLTTGIALLLVMRLFAAVSSAAIADIGVMLVAAWLPLLTLWLVEELRRRHAPRPLKFFALFGALGFSVLTLIVGPWWSAAAMIALAAYQAAMLTALVALLARRDDLSSAEWASAQMLLAALLCALPLTLTDFTAIFPDLPVRGGVFALMLLLLAAARLAHERARPLWLLYDMLGLLAVGALTYCAAIPLSADQALPVAAVAALAAAVLLLADRLSSAHAASTGLVIALARLPDGATRASMLAAHPLLSTGRLITETDLAGYPRDLVGALAQRRVIRDTGGASMEDEAARDLLSAASASHLLRLASSPLTFLAVNAGGLSGAGLDAELGLAAHMLEHAR